MKKLVWGLAVFLQIVGVVWVLQGVGELPGSFMSGHLKWAYYGVGLILFAVVLYLIAAFFIAPGKRPPRDEAPRP